MDDRPGGVWLSLAEAAVTLGVSEKTLRRRIKAGQVDARQEPTKYGQAWKVWVDTPLRLPSPLSTGQEDTDGYGQGTGQGGQATPGEGTRGDRVALDLLQLVRELLAKNETLQVQLQQRDEQIRALTAPTEASTAAHAPESAQEGQQGASAAGVVSDDLGRPVAAPRRAWWRFW